MTRLAKHLTYANVISTLCLLLILGTGTAYAANTVFSADIVDGEVKTADLAANSVTSGKIATSAVSVTDIRDDAVTSSKVGANALTGADINEGTLAGVNAGTVGGMSVKKINFQVPYGTSQRLILDFPGKFAIYGECQDFGDIVDLKAVTRVEGSTIVAWVNQSSFILNDADGKQDIQSWFHDDFDPPEIFNLDDILYKGSTTSRAMRIEFATPSGFVAHVDLFVWVRQFEPEGCVVFGTAVGG